jgi:site-specific DNA recombinase
MLRCAIYTRKSTEEGLEQDFNSLQAQREACEAFITSQKQEGWKAVRSQYDDGGYSGGTMDRPGLQNVLADVLAQKIQVVVVYKVDRLTRSLPDFAKIVSVFDENKVSFVSVTQPFNTTSSMGRLTLNVLLSFAQFEREVTAERIRDKIAASKKKGMWMGGLAPLGYDVVDRKLVVNIQEAATVRNLFKLYLRLGTVRRLKEEADRQGIRTKVRGQGSFGGKPFSRGNLYQSLSNPHYIGRTPHKGQSYPGQHEAIIAQGIWDRAQTQLLGNKMERSHPTNRKASFLLTGKIFDETGDRLYQAQTAKGQKRYKYYVSKRLVHEANDNGDGWRISATTLETAATTAIQEFLNDPAKLMDAMAEELSGQPSLKSICGQARDIASCLDDNDHRTKREVLQELVDRVDIASGTLSITIDGSKLAKKLGAELTQGETLDVSPIRLDLPFHLRRRGVEGRMVIPGSKTASTSPDPHLCRLVAQGRLWFEQLISGEVSSVRAIAEREQVHESEVSRVLPLAFLAPKIVELILDGKQPVDLTATVLKRHKHFQGNWKAQHKQLGIEN